MAFIRGGDLTVTLVRPGAIQQALTLFANNVSISFAADMLETTTLSDQVRDYTPGLRSGTMTISGMYDDTVTASTGVDYQLETMLNNGELVNWAVQFGTGTTRTWRNSGYSTGSPALLTVPVYLASSVQTKWLDWLLSVFHSSSVECSRSFNRLRNALIQLRKGRLIMSKAKLKELLKPKRWFTKSLRVSRFRSKSFHSRNVSNGVRLH